MEYYCNICRKTISPEEFSFSMNRYKKALCRDHLKSQGMSGATKDLQEMMRKRRTDEVKQDLPQLKTVKDWINADFDTWDKVVKKEDDEQDTRGGSEKERKKKKDSIIDK
jgi:hypothetical protein